jgi:uncharacterized membrane protein YfcA
MHIEFNYIISAIVGIMLLAYTGDAMVGFGSSVIAVTLGAHVYPIDLLIPVIVPMHIITNSFIAFRNRSHIDRKLLLRRILPLMAIGGLIGLALFPIVKGPALQLIFGVMVVVFTIRELTLLFKGTASGRPMSQIEASLWQFCAGVIHGIYATGGPMLVYSLARQELPKAVFRATLCTVWAVLSVLLTIAFAINGRVNLATLTMTAYILPAVPIGIALGGWLHNRVSERGFRFAVCFLLLLAALVLLVRAV